MANKWIFISPKLNYNIKSDKRTEKVKLAITYFMLTKNFCYIQVFSSLSNSSSESNMDLGGTAVFIC